MKKAIFRPRFLSVLQSVKEILQDYLSREGIDHRLALCTASIGLVQESGRCHGSHALVHHSNGKSRQFLYLLSKRAATLGTGSLRAVHVHGTPYNHRARLLFGGDLSDFCGGLIKSAHLYVSYTRSQKTTDVRHGNSRAHLAETTALLRSDGDSITKIVGFLV